MIKVTADGTYITQTALTLRNPATSYERCDTVQRPVLQAALFDADYMSAVVLAVALVKLFCRFLAQISANETGYVSEADIIKRGRKINSFAAESMLIISSAIHLAKSQLLSHQVNPDHLDRMWICLKVNALA
ncbi:unnamed protein product [Protopolystoma xenopodis]|uniref:Uncharacterized protein n=1 Tax=Protopolystoma xenopodis TaxID=117903 RepID=A0A3S5CDR7_9PLAT|nr:unnamed protein product [Protopolystoma xenopodis]